MVSACALEHLPMLVFFAAKQITSVRERWHPAAVHFARIPAHMIEMHVAAQNFCNRVRRVSGTRQVLDERALHIAEYRELALAIVPDARVDHDLLVSGA